MEPIIFGDYDLIKDDLPAEGTIYMRLKPIDIVTYWRRCGAVANFVASFYKDDTDSKLNENLISTVFNELIENASKYSNKRDSEITIDIRLYNIILLMQVKNVCNKTHFEAIKNRLELLLSPNVDLNDIYIEEMEKKMAGAKDSGVGLLMLLKDFKIQFGTKIVPLGDDNYEINVQAYYFMEGK